MLCQYRIDAFGLRSGDTEKSIAVNRFSSGPNAIAHAVMTSAHTPAPATASGPPISPIARAPI